MYQTRNAALASLHEFSEALRKRHHIVRLPSGLWCRTLGPPDASPTWPETRLTNVRGREWRIDPVDPEFYARFVASLAG